jgi:hypothetical protein
MQLWRAGCGAGAIKAGAGNPQIAFNQFTLSGNSLKPYDLKLKEFAAIGQGYHFVEVQWIDMGFPSVPPQIVLVFNIYSPYHRCIRQRVDYVDVIALLYWQQR